MKASLGFLFIVCSSPAGSIGSSILSTEASQAEFKSCFRGFIFNQRS